MFNIHNLKAIPVLLLFFLLPISTAGANIALTISILIAIIYFLLNQNSDKFTEIKKQPFLVLSLFFCLLFFCSVLLQGFSKSSVIDLIKYQEIFWVPALAFLIASHKNINFCAVIGFLIAMGLTLLMSYVRGFTDNLIFDFLNFKSLLPKLGDIKNPTVFKWHITHNFFMAFAALLWGYFSIYFWKARRVWALGFAFLCILALANIFFMVQGRTGYLVIFSTVLYFFINKFRSKGIYIGVIAVGFLSVFLYYFSNNFQSRVDLGVAELMSWNPNIPSDTSIGLRLEFIYQSLQIAREHMFFGVGVGNFGPTYATHILNSGMVASSNPHNQYLLFLVEVGLVGLTAFLYLNFICWKYSKKLSPFWMHATRIVLLSYGVANLFNSFLFDFSESLFFSAFMALAFSELLRNNKVTVSA